MMKMTMVLLEEAVFLFVQLFKSTVRYEGKSRVVYSILNSPATTFKYLYHAHVGALSMVAPVEPWWCEGTQLFG